MTSRLDELKAKRDALSNEYNAIQAEYSAGKKFLTGAAETDRENRETAKFRELSAVNREIRLEEGQVSAAGQTAEQKVVNDAPPSSDGDGTAPSAITDPQPLDAAETAKVKAANDGTTESAVDSSKDPFQPPPVEGAASEAAAANGEKNKDAKQKEAEQVQGPGVSGDKTEADKQVRVDISVVAPGNPLNEYTSYTYRITLFLLTKNDFNALAAAPSKFIPKYALISSGGGYAGEPGTQSDGTPIAGRHPDFQDEFFIDNLTITTVVGLNAKTKASNSVEIGFRIVEPYGMSLLDRLLSACETSEDNCLNYIDQPYLLQIDFLASPTDPEYFNRQLIMQKRIAIKMLGLRINPATGGTTYQVEAIPYNHSAFSMSVAAVPVNFSVSASTVGDFFSSQQDLVQFFQYEIAANNERVETELAKWKATYQSHAPTPSIAEIEAARDRIKATMKFNTGSFAAAYNTYMTEIANSKGQSLSQQPPTKIAFNIPDARIANSLIVDTKTAQSGDNEMTDAEKAILSVNPDYKRKQVFQINPGTNIVDVIDDIVKKSEYITKQINAFDKILEEQKAEDEYQAYVGDRPRRTIDGANDYSDLDWYKIIPQVILDEFDFTRNAYAKKILYSILPYKAANQYHPNFKKTLIKTSSAVRKYEYLYTGQNTDIIRLDIDFDSTYYTQLTTFRNQVNRSGSNNTSDAKDAETTRLGIDTSETTATKLPAIREFGGHNASANKMNAANSPSAQLVSDLSNSIYSNSRGELLNIKLTIIGDPSFIKQDDIYYNPGSDQEYKNFLVGSTGTSNRPINSTTGQILFDREQVYVSLIFKNAVDINDTVGIVNKQTKLKNNRSTNGTFTGMYRVITVRSEFSKGQFTQVLDLIRTVDYIDDLTGPIATDNQNRLAIAKDESGQTDVTAVDANQPANNAAEPVAAALSDRLVAAGNGPTTVTPEVTSGDGTAPESDQQSSAAPSNANDAQAVAPQQTAIGPLK